MAQNLKKMHMILVILCSLIITLFEPLEFNDMSMNVLFVYLYIA